MPRNEIAQAIKIRLGDEVVEDVDHHRASLLQATSLTPSNKSRVSKLCIAYALFPGRSPKGRERAMTISCNARQVSSMHGKAAGNADGLPGDVAGVVGEEEGDESWVIFRHAQPLHGYRPFEAFCNAR